MRSRPGADPGIGSGGGGGETKVRVWQGWGKPGDVAAPGRVRGGGHPTRPARGSGGALQGGLGRSPEANGFCVVNPQKYVKTAPKTL